MNGSVSPSTSWLTRWCKVNKKNVKQIKISNMEIKDIEFAIRRKLIWNTVNGRLRTSIEVSGNIIKEVFVKGKLVFVNILNKDKEQNCISFSNLPNEFIEVIKNSLI